MLVARTGIEHAEIVIAPSLSPRQFITASTPDWLRDRYELLAARLAGLGATS